MIAQTTNTEGGGSREEGEGTVGPSPARPSASSSIGRAGARARAGRDIDKEDRSHFSVCPFLGNISHPSYDSFIRPH